LLLPRPVVGGFAVGAASVEKVCKLGFLPFYEVTSNIPAIAVATSGTAMASYHPIHIVSGQ
jgi:hypothetical protein